MSNVKKIMLDAGHGLPTPGKRTLNGANGVVQEWSMNHAVVNYITQYLNAYKVEVAYCYDRSGKVDTPLTNRTKTINEYMPDALVSIHQNAHKGAWGGHTGVEVYIHTLGTTQDEELANQILPRLAAETGLKNRGVKKAALAILGVNPKIPAILAEGGFMDSTIDYPVITSKDGQVAYAKAVADGIIKYLKLDKKEATTAKTYTVIKKISGFANADDAKNNRNPKTTVVAGDYYIYKDSNGMINVTRTQESPGSWINPNHNVKQSYYPATQAGGNSLVDALKAINVDSSLTNRGKIAATNGISSYTASALQNDLLLALLRKGKLLRP